MKINLIIIFILLLLSLSQAQEFESYNLEVSLKPSGLVHEKIETSFLLDQDTSSVIFSIDQDIKNVKVYENSQNLESSLTNKGILIMKDIKKGQLSNVFIEFDSKDLVKQSGKDFIFSLDFSLPVVTKELKVDLNLPKGFVLSDIESPVSPKTSAIKTDGRLITINWDLSDMKEESFIVIYKRGFESKSESFILLYSLMIFIVLLLVSILIIFIYQKKNRKFIMSTLSDDEKQIIKYIKKEKGITQKKISQITGFSKSKMSKITRRLEEKEIIKKIPWFKTNKFNLSKRLR